MKLNHLHINVPSVKKAQDFYQKFFDFKIEFEHGEGVFLKDETGFLMAIDPLKEGEKVEFPKWFHFGFCLDSAKEVKFLYEKMKSGGVEFVREYTEFGENAANFYCIAPGPYQMEVAWNRDS